MFWKGSQKRNLGNVVGTSRIPCNTSHLIVLLSCFTLMIIEEDLGIMVNTLCTTIWEGGDRNLNPFAFTCSR